MSFVCFFDWTRSNIPQNISCMGPYLPSLKLSKLDEQNMWDAAGEVRTNSSVIFSYGPLHIDVQVLDDQLELIYNSSTRTQDVV